MGSRDDESDDGEGTAHPHGYSKWSGPRKRIYGILASEKTDWFLATMILSSLVLLCIDADLSAKQDSGLTEDEQVRKQIVSVISTCYTGVYAMEMVARVYVFRRDVFRTAMIFDFLIVMADVAMVVVDFTLGDSFASVSFLRMFRLARLFRFVRVVGMFPELQFLVKGFISSFSAVFWGSILMWIVILMWAIIAVYWIHPIHLAAIGKDNNDELTIDFGECGRRCRAWRSVWDSVITLCQTVVFGDSWGLSAIGIIEEEPWTIIFFAGMYGTISLGVLNLIVAAIVDSGAQAREEALEAKRRKQRIEEQKQKERQKNRLLEICKVLDDDESGSLSFEELLQGFDKNAEFRTAMKDYNINRAELDVLFRVFDEDGEGVLDYQEFFNLIDSAREQASQQVLTFVRFAVMDLRKEIKAGQEQLKSELDLIKDLVLSAEHSLGERICRFSGEPPPTRKVPNMKAPSISASNNSSFSSGTGVASPPTGGAKAVARPVTKPKEPRSRESPGSRHGTDHSLQLPQSPPERIAPLQQLLKINRELLKGMKKLLDANQVDIAEVAHTAGASLSPNLSEAELDGSQLRLDSERILTSTSKLPSSLSSGQGGSVAVPRVPVRSYFPSDPDERRTSI